MDKKEAVRAPSGDGQEVMSPNRQKLWQGWVNSFSWEQIGVYDTWICSFCAFDEC